MKKVFKTMSKMFSLDWSPWLTAAIMMAIIAILATMAS